jgi:glutamate/tyrosine decarboxylase-like PLP-dependent enzyme
MSIDPHKWLFVPLDAGCVLLRDEQCSRAAFAFDSEYARVMQSEPIERFAFFDHGIDLSRRARALKVWMILKAHGTREISRVIASNIALRASLDRRISAEPELELLGSGLSISCFRFVPVDRGAVNRGAVDRGAETEPGDLDELNRRLLDRLLAEGRSYMSPTTLEGRFSLRVCIVSFRTRQSDMDLLLDDVLRIGRELGP